MKYASIDIGTNTLRLLVAESHGGGRFLRPLIYKRAITRLGGNYTEEAGIDAGAAKRTIEALEDFKRAIDEAGGVDDVLAVATSVVRRAKNRERFLAEVFKRTGISVSVISGAEEARLSLLGVLSVLADERRMRLVMDVGGGSTEFISADGVKLVGAWSMEMGVVHLTERHLKSDPPSAGDKDSLEKEIKDVLGELKGRMTRDSIDPSGFSSNSGALLVGTAGTITTLAALDQDLAVYDRERINNYTLARVKVRRMYERLSAMKIKEREAILSLEKGREDLIIPGSAITLLVMDAFGFDEIKVSDAGLLEGIILDRAGITPGLIRQNPEV